jgi:hypothetical protein
MAKSKVSLSSADISAKWNSRMKGAVQDIVKGIDAVTENPAQKAIAAKDKMLRGVTAAINDGRWENGLQKVDLNQWKTKTKQKVSERLSGGVDAAMSKRRDFDQWLTSTLNGILPQVAAKEKMTLEDGIERVRMIATHLRDNRYKNS